MDNAYFKDIDWQAMWDATGQTLYMTAISVLARLC